MIVQSSLSRAIGTTRMWNRCNSSTYLRRSSHEPLHCNGKTFSYISTEDYYSLSKLQYLHFQSIRVVNTGPLMTVELFHQWVTMPFSYHLKPLRLNQRINSRSAMRQSGLLVSGAMFRASI